ncbi:unnamed protein product, partial [Tetraodon nigroviridis]
VDSMLDPDNRVHMTVEEQLKELLEKLDLVTSMRCSGARTKRIRLLRREINTIRHRQGQHPRNSLLNGHLKEEEDEEEEEEEGKEDAKADNGLSPVDKEDFKSSSPPTLEPTEPAPPPRQGDTPLEPPTLRPITGEPRSPNWPCKRLRLDEDPPGGPPPSTDRSEPPASPPALLHTEGRAAAAPNGLPEPDSPQRASTGGVGRRTSVLFKKAKNGAKLFRERDGAVPNGKGPPGDAPGSAGSTPATTPLSTPTKTPQKSPTRLLLNQKRTPGPDLRSNTEAEMPKDAPERDAAPAAARRSSEALGNRLFLKSPSQKRSTAIRTTPGTAAERRRTRRSWSLWSWCGLNVVDTRPIPLWVKPPPQKHSHGKYERQASKRLRLADCCRSSTQRCLRRACCTTGCPSPSHPKTSSAWGEQRQEESDGRLYLVLFFDNKRTWTVAPARQGDAFGFGRHRRQTADNGGPQVQHPQVGPGGVRPRHDPPEPGQPQKRFRGLRVPVGGARGGGARGPPPQAEHYAFLPRLLVKVQITLEGEESAVRYQNH